MEVRDHLFQAKRCERSARWLTLQVNMEMFGRNLSNIKTNSLSLFDNARDGGFGRNKDAPPKTPMPTMANSRKTDEEKARDKLASGILHEEGEYHLTAGSTKASRTSTGGAMHTDYELVQMTEKITALLQEAQMHRGLAMQEMSQTMQSQMTADNLSIIQVQRQQMNKEMQTSMARAMMRPLSHGTERIRPTEPGIQQWPGN